MILLFKRNIMKITYVTIHMVTEFSICGHKEVKFNFNNVFYLSQYF